MENNNLFLKAFHGSLVNLLTWADWEACLARLAADAEGWYVYALAEGLPTAPLTSENFQIFLKEINVLLREAHQESYCGIVYVDDRLRPNFVKIYDPHHLGAVCGSSGAAVLPGWVFSRLSPVLLTPPPIKPLNHKNFLKKLLTFWQKDS